MFPRELMCIQCIRGGAKLSRRIHAITERILADPDIHIKLISAFDEIGARTKAYDQLTPEFRKRDLDVLIKLGLVPGDIRTARDLLFRISELIKTNQGICDYDHEKNYAQDWSECPIAFEGFYAAGNHDLPYRDRAEQLKDKAHSTYELSSVEQIKIRPHHMLCVICFAGHDNTEPLLEDNLFEVLEKIRKNPDLLIEFVDGPGECAVCPPCHGFVAERGLCVCRCHLRDRKKDLETMLRLGVRPGDVLPASEVLARIQKYIPTVVGICELDSPNSFEWGNCDGVHTLYEKGLTQIETQKDFL